MLMTFGGLRTLEIGVIGKRSTLSSSWSWTSEAGPGVGFPGDGVGVLRRGGRVICSFTKGLVWAVSLSLSKLVRIFWSLKNIHG